MLQEWSCRRGLVDARYVRNAGHDTFAIKKADTMAQTVQTAEQIRDEAQSRVANISAEVPGVLRVRIPLPERHPPDATGRNWAMVALNESGTEYLRSVRRVIEDMRTEFVLPD
jgi:hypothetical protein